MANVLDHIFLVNFTFMAARFVDARRDDVANLIVCNWFKVNDNRIETAVNRLQILDEVLSFDVDEAS